MAKGDVELVIKARDEAAKALDTITSALKRLQDSQNDVTASANNSGSALGRLGSEVQRAAQQLKTADSFGKITQGVDQATAAYERQKTEVADLQSKYQSLNAQIGSGAKVQKDLADGVQTSANAVAGLKAQLKDAQKAYTDLNRQSNAKSSANLSSEDAKALAAQTQQAKIRVDELRSAFDTASAVQGEYQRRLSLVNTSLKDLDSQASKTATALDQQKNSLANSESSLIQISAIANKATADFNDLKAAEDRLAQSEGLDRVKASMKGFSSLSATVNDLNAIAQAQKKLDQASSSASAGGATINRADVLQTKKDLVDLQVVAQGGWKNAQFEIQDLMSTIVKLGPPTREEAEQFERLTTIAQTSKAVFTQLQGAINGITNTLRNSSASSNDLANAQKTAQSAINGARTAFSQQTSALADIRNYYEGVAASARRSAGEVRNNADANRKSAADAKAAADALKELNEGSRESLSLFQRLRGQVLAITASYIGLQSILSQITQSIKDFQALEATQSRLRVVFDGDPEKVAQELDFISREAARLGINVSTLADEYSKFAVAAKGTVIEGENTRKIFNAVSEAGRVNKLSVDQMQGVYLALTQMLSKGRIASEELRKQLGERLPGAFKIMADSLGITTAELDKRLELGNVPIETLIKFADKLQETFGSQLNNAINSTTFQLGKLDNQLTSARLVFDKAGFAQGLTEGLKSLNEFLGSAEAESDLEKLGKAAGVLAGILLQIPTHVRALTAAFSLFIGLKVGNYLTALVINFQATRAAAAATEATIVAGAASSTVAVGRLGTAFAALRGAVSGLGWGAILGAVAVGLSVWATKTEDATEALNKHKKSIDLVKNAYDESGRSVDNWKKKLEGVTLIGAQADVAKLGELKNQFTQDLTDPFLNATERAKKSNTELYESAKPLIALVNQLKAGTITLEDFRKGLDNIGQTSKSSNIKGVTLDLEEKTRPGTKFDEIYKSYNEAQLVVKALGKDTAQANQAIEQLNGSLALDPQKQAALDNEAYIRSLNNIKTSVTSLNKELDKAQKLSKIQTELETGLSHARTESQKAEIQTTARRAQAGIDPASFLGQFGGGNLDKNALTGLSDDIAKTLADVLAKLPPEVAKQISIQKGAITFDQSVAAFNAAKARDPNAQISTPGTSPYEKGRAFDLNFGNLSPSYTNAVLELLKSNGLIQQTVTAVTASTTSSTAVAAIADIVVTKSSARGLRNRNPGNLENSRVPFQGQTSGADSRFISFDSDVNGIRALARTLITSQEKHGNDNIADIIERFSPAKENGKLNTDAYIADVAKKTGFAISEKLNLRDQDTLNKLVNAIISHENGRNPYSAQTVSAGVSSALGKTNLRAGTTTVTKASQNFGFVDQGTAADGAKAQFQEITSLTESVTKGVQAAQVQLDQLTGKNENDINKINQAIAEANQKQIDQVTKLQILQNKQFDDDIAAYQDKQTRESVSYAKQIADIQALKQIANDRAASEIAVYNALTLQQQAAATQKANAKKISDAESELNKVVQLRAAILEQINYLETQGSNDATPERLNELRDRLKELDLQVPTLAENLRQVGLAIGGPEGEKAVLTAERLALAGKDAKNAYTGFAAQVNQTFAQDLTTGLIDVTKALAEGIAGTKSWGQAFKDAGDAFRKFASDFLLQIAEMIIKAEVLNALGLSGSDNSNSKGGIGGALAGLLGLNKKKKKEDSSDDGFGTAEEDTASIFGDSTDGAAGGAGGIFDALFGESGLLGQFTSLGTVLQSVIGLFGGGSGGGGLIGAFSSLLSSLFGGSSGGGGGGIGSLVSAGLSVLALHTGGVVGSTDGFSKPASPAWFTGALKYHSGGLPGLQADEVPAILKKREEVLTADDPRNVLNGGKNSSGSSSAPANSGGVKVVNLFDSEDVMTQALGTAAGEKAIINLIKRNKSAVKNVLG